MAIQNKSAEATRNFDPTSIPGLSYKARDAVNAAFQAMSTWRSEVADNSEKNIKRVIEKMATAAAELGWPEQMVDAARTQMQSITEMQIKTMDHMMDAWEEQLKLPNPTNASPAAMLQKLKSSPSSGSFGNWPGADLFQMGATNPMQFWMQVAEHWQKSWTDTMTGWAKAGNSGLRHH
jgi:ribonuclease D